jgi:hypothetical protein
LATAKVRGDHDAALPNALLQNQSLGHEKDLFYRRHGHP